MEYAHTDNIRYSQLCRVVTTVAVIIIIIIIISSGFMPSMRETEPKRHYKVNH